MDESFAFAKLARARRKYFLINIDSRIPLRNKLYIKYCKDPDLERIEEQKYIL